MFKKIFTFCRITITSSPLYFAMNLAFIFTMACSWLMMSYSSKLLVNSIISAQALGNYSFSVVLPSLLFFLAITLGGNYFNFESMLVAIYTRRSRKLFSKLFLYKSSKVKQDKFYDNRFYNDYEFVKNNIGTTTDITVSIFNKLMISVFSVALSVMVIATFDVYILACILVLSAGITFLNKYLVKKRVELNQKYVNDERKAAYFRDLLSGRNHVRELRIFKLRSFILKKWDASYRKYTVGKYSFELKAALLGSTVGFLQIIMEKGISIYFMYLVYIGRASAGDCVFLIGVMGGLGRSITNIVDILSNEINEKYKYADKYEAFIGDMSQDELDKTETSGIGAGRLCCGDFEELKLSNISYKYPQGNESALNNVDFCLKKGEVVSILGYNGSGKTTLSKAICGLLEDYSGRITINGKNLTSFNKEDIFKYFGVAFQEFSKYSISLKENVAVGMIEKSNDISELIKAIKKGNLEEIINKLPHRENTVLGKEYDKDGQDLSGGQWQRIVLSRAYMGEPEILILDEPTASIDPIEEMRMLNHFKEIIKGKTAILISHRIGFARISDRICIMENGSIVEEGSHNELINLRGRYYELFSSQKELYQETQV